MCRPCRAGSVAVQCDVTSDDSVKALAAVAARVCGSGGLHAVVNNAGIAGGFVVDLTPLETYQRVMDVNFYGGVRVTKSLLPLVVRIPTVRMDARGRFRCFDMPCLSRRGERVRVRVRE